MSDILSLTVEDIADRLREAAAAAQAAQSLVIDGKNREGLELLVEHMLPLQEALTIIRLIALRAIRQTKQF